MTTLEILRAAKALIPDENHWSAPNGNRLQGYGDEHCVCMAGAIYTAINGRPGGRVSLDDTPASDLAFDVLANAIEVDGQFGIERFNDADTTTLADVHAAFDTAIAAEEAKVTA